MSDRAVALYKELNNEGVNFYHWRLGEDQAATVEVDGKYGVFMDFDYIDTEAEELTILAHEGGHIATGATHKVNSPFDVVEQHERKANKWAIEKLVPRAALWQAVSSGIREPWELADHFGVTEPFMRTAICWYRFGALDTEYYFGEG